MGVTVIIATIESRYAGEQKFVHLGPGTVGEKVETEMTSYVEGIESSPPSR